MENILWDDVVFKLRKNKAETCSLLDAIGCRSCGRWRVGIKIDVWENPVLYASTRDWSSLYGAIRSEPEATAQSSCSHFWTSLGTLMLSLFCMHRSGCSYCDASGEFLSPLSPSPLLRVSIKKKKKSQCHPTTVWQFIRIEANVRQPFQVPRDSAFDRLKMNISRPSARYHSGWRSWR